MKSTKSNPQGLKPGLYYQAFAARLKSCPDYKTRVLLVFPQPVKSCPDTYGGSDKGYSAACEDVPFQELDRFRGFVGG
jgi:hypothetical protein